ncbi:4-alpha-glucanotransferase [Rhodobium gokarnense]|uniref:4-alpha-glucanotransferase n=1 Tax=Rhodobium gokarnense TaxID=364296 RepID=A0ABT3H7A0_9HYPH|nr:4-alpha-glucanotransferase [Rhodobium gokarnense]MCW2306273.1 4-alpha-glucanotransferase [Rhodobium gokarnense]
MSGFTERLDRLADMLGIERHVYDSIGAEHIAPDESLRAIIAAMGYAADTEADLDAALDAVTAIRTARLIPETWCVNEGSWLCFPVRAERGAYRRTIVLEDGQKLEADGLLENLHPYHGEAVASRALLVTEPVPVGIHRVTLETGERREEATLIVAPARAFGVTDATGGRDRLWGLMAPLYGLVSQRNFGVGDYEDLGRLSEIAAGLGADFVGVNPVHALFPEEPEAASPYSPSSRLFLNVMQIAPDRVPEFAASEAARRFASDKAGALAADRTKAYVDYNRVAGIKLPIFEQLFATFRQAADPDRIAAFDAFRAARGDRLRKHALFDALSRHFAVIGCRRGWMHWPRAYRDPDTAAVADFEHDFERDVTFFEYLQWIADEQLGDAAARADAAGMALGLYLDLAVGVTEGSADCWTSPGDYARGVSLGAPPDAFSADGQCWGLLPLNVGELRRRHFRPFIELLRSVMRHAGVIRIDHILGLARCFWVPHGLPGAYVRYPLHDLLAIIAVESHRAKTVVIGEDLGNIPDGLHEALTGRGILGCRAAYFERTGNGDYLSPHHYPRDVLASVGTHDLPPLRGFWEGCDLAWRFDIADLSEDEEKAEITGRIADRHALCRLVGHDVDFDVDPIEDPCAFGVVSAGLTAQLAESPASLVALESENVLGLTERTNMPGTTDEHPNWCRRLPVDIEDLAERADVQNAAKTMNAARGHPDESDG